MIKFVIYGKPQPAGSKRAFAIRKGGVLTGKVTVVDAAKGSRSWKQEVAKTALEHKRWAYGNDSPLLRGPLVLVVTFMLRRPAGHYGTGKNATALRAGAPLFPAVKPDATKLLRAIEDALTGIIWADDAQIVSQVALKRYAHLDQPEHVEVYIDHADGPGVPGQPNRVTLGGDRVIVL